MTWLPPPQAQQLRDALRLHGRELKEVRPNEWQMELRNGRPIRVRAVVREPFLTLDASAHPTGQKADPWQILLCLGTYPPLGEACPMLDPRTGEMRVRSEVFLHEKVNLPARVGAACDALVRVGSYPFSARENGGNIGQDEASSPGASEPLGSRLGDLLGTEQWDWVERDDGSLSVPLREAGGTRCRIGTGSGDGFLARAEFHGASSGTARQRRAMGHFLLTGAGMFRLVHPFAATDEKGDRVGFGVVLPSDVTAMELINALAALSLATGRLRRSAVALTDPAVAARYLKFRASGPKPSAKGSRARAGRKRDGQKSKRAKKNLRPRRSALEAVPASSQGGD